MQGLQAAGRVCPFPGAQLQRRHTLDLIVVNLDQTEKKCECISREETGYVFVDVQHLAEPALDC